MNHAERNQLELANKLISDRVRNVGLLHTRGEDAYYLEYVKPKGKLFDKFKEYDNNVMLNCDNWKARFEFFEQHFKDELNGTKGLNEVLKCVGTDNCWTVADLKRIAKKYGVENLVALREDI